MKRLYAMLFAFVVSALSVPAFADAPASSSSVTIQVTPQDVASMKEKMTELSAALGNPTAAASAAPAPAATAEHKTAGDVADKALNLFSSMVGQVSDVLKKIAPEVWRIMIRQQYAKAAFNVIAPTMLLISTLVSWKFLKPRLEPRESDKSDVRDARAALRFLLLFAPIAWCIWLALGIASSAEYVINPEYYAIKDLLLLLTNPSAAQ